MYNGMPTHHFSPRWHVSFSKWITHSSAPPMTLWLQRWNSINHSSGFGQSMHKRPHVLTVCRCQPLSTAALLQSQMVSIATRKSGHRSGAILVLYKISTPRRNLNQGYNFCWWQNPASSVVDDDVVVAVDHYFEEARDLCSAWKGETKNNAQISTSRSASHYQVPMGAWRTKVLLVGKSVCYFDMLYTYTHMHILFHQGNNGSFSEHKGITFTSYCNPLRNLVWLDGWHALQIEDSVSFVWEQSLSGLMDKRERMFFRLVSMILWSVHCASLGRIFQCRRNEANLFHLSNKSAFPVESSRNHELHKAVCSSDRKHSCVHYTCNIFTSSLTDALRLQMPLIRIIPNLANLPFPICCAQTLSIIVTAFLKWARVRQSWESWKKKKYPTLVAESCNAPLEILRLTVRLFAGEMCSEFKTGVPLVLS